MNYFSESEYGIMYGNERSAGLDLPFFDPDIEAIHLSYGQSCLIKTGIHIEIPLGHVGILDTRSSTGKAKVDLLCRTIDDDYRGNIRLMIINHNTEPLVIRRGDYIAQIVIMKCNDDRVLNRVGTMEELSKTDRNDRGFGHTGNTNLGGNINE